MKDIDDYIDESGSTTIVETQQMVLSPGWVAVPFADYQVREAMLQRMVILIERIESGEKLTKEQLLRALGRFDSAIDEMLNERFGRKENEGH